MMIIILIFRRGSLLSTAIFVYAATSPVNGYFGGGMYSRMGGKLWIRQVHIVLGNIYNVPYYAMPKKMKILMIIFMYFRC